ncbi:MAG: hypothetical protein IT448_02930 [Phycisphaerales bacterium]|nr:hypothetical protein [Phycisphaerales bacterium]
MTQTSMSSSNQPASSDQPEKRSVARGAVVTILICSLLLVMAGRWLTGWQRQRVLTNDGRVPMASEGGGSNLSGMNSFALALLLGGLRGPLVMFLWQNSESQKQERNLETFDTQVEWIRMLQPEFDSVHIFQMWNKGYNISVQKASLANKYLTILDALDYGYSVDSERPHNINIIETIGQLFFDKFGNSAEKEYYRQRVRTESQWRQTQPQRAAITSSVRLEPRLNPDGYILPQYLTAPGGDLPRPTDLAADKPWNTGADLQYLKPFEPFPYGISPLAFAYNYFKRAQVLQDSAGQTHAQLSHTVIDSRPALALKFWSEAEWERGRKIEGGLLRVHLFSTEQQEEQKPFGNETLEPRDQLELLTIPLGFNSQTKKLNDQPLEADTLPELLFSYQRAADLAAAAIQEYERYLNETDFLANISTYESHVEHMRSVHAAALADLAYVRGLMLPAGAQRQEQFKQAAEHYHQSIRINEFIQLRYFTDVRLLQLLGADRQSLRKLPQSRLDQLAQQARDAIYAGAANPDAIDRNEYERYATRAHQRLTLMGL